jgi:ubiquinone/menaquinone biosynthesis C-methylase UbiE
MADAEGATRTEAAGLVIHGAVRYDLLVWLFTLGAERRFRRKLLALARLQAGETVLDIGCGTGTLAIEAKRAVGVGGVVHGVDASPEMIARAQYKARRAKTDVRFVESSAQKLPLGDGAADVVLSTLMLHHLPKSARPAIAREIKRVLKPGGRVLAIDFAKPAAGKPSLMDKFHRHGFIKLEDFIAELEEAGLGVVESAQVGERNLHYVLASPSAAGPGDARLGHSTPNARPKHGPDHPDGRGRGLWIGIGLAVALVLLAIHAGLAMALYRGVADMRLSAIILAALGGLALIFVLLHLLGAKLILAWTGARQNRVKAD